MVPLILDSHCHAWRRWPYSPLVPDEDSRGRIEQLIYEMDTNGVEQALVVCAAIENNADNVEYVAFARDRYPGRLHVVADLDCTWSATYHEPDAEHRLAALDDRYGLVGFTHYVLRNNDGWLLSDGADRLFALAESRRLIVSLAASPAWQADLRTIALRYPSVPVLCHHLGGTHAGDDDSDEIEQLLGSVDVPNIYVKVSGFHYCSDRGWDHPWRDALLLFRRIYDAFGPTRLCWGSDFPASTRHCTYRQSIEVVRMHCDFLSPEDLALILGGNLRQILESLTA